MDRVVAARKLVAELVKGEQIELRRAEIVGRELARFAEALGRPPSGEELEDWLGAHPQVTELYAGPVLLDELVERYLAPPPPSEPASAPEARHPELERQLRDEPDRGELYLVYADWLQERGDPLGELIALGVAATGNTGDAALRFERHLKRHEAHLLGPLARQLADRVALHWRYGVVHALEELAEPLAPPAWERLLGLRVCELVQALALRRPCSPELDAAIAAAAGELLRALTLEGCSGSLPERLLRRELRSLAVAGGRIAIAPEALPASLDRLELRVHEVVAEGGAPPRLAVRELDVALTAPLAALLAGAQLPRLERLSLRLGAEPASALPELLRAIHAPALIHLAIRDGVLDPGTFAELSRLPLAARLRSLALTSLELTDLAMRAMARARGAFEALAALDVSHNELSRDGLAAARELAPEVISRRQHRRGNGAERRVRAWAGSRLQVAEGIAEPQAWRDAGADGDLRWARYRGGEDYELFVTADLQRYGCTCPSSIQPCKHVVALALIAERTGLPEAPSGGIEDRVNRRRTSPLEG